jgi:hypothetical protein
LPCGQPCRRFSFRQHRQQLAARVIRIKQPCGQPFNFEKSRIKGWPQTLRR